MSVPEFHEVRVRARGVRLNPDSNATSQVSTRSDFVAPYLAPVATTEIEQAKGLAGWSDGPKPEDKRPVQIARWERARKLQTAEDLDGLVLGTAIATVKAPAATLVKRNVQGPSTRTRSKFC